MVELPELYGQMMVRVLVLACPLIARANGESLCLLLP